MGLFVYIIYNFSGYLIINIIFNNFNNKVFFMNIQESALRMEIKNYITKIFY
jgi:hypothetical protein